MLWLVVPSVIVVLGVAAIWAAGDAGSLGVGSTGHDAAS
jgi:hypothetical protein